MVFENSGKRQGPYGGMSLSPRARRKILLFYQLSHLVTKSSKKESSTLGGKGGRLAAKSVDALAK